MGTFSSLNGNGIDLAYKSADIKKPGPWNEARISPTLSVDDQTPDERMRTKAAEAIDLNSTEDLIFTTNYGTTAHKWAMTCGTCGRTCYVNDQVHKAIVLAIEAHSEDLFHCDICTADITDWPSKIAASQSSGHRL